MSFFDDKIADRLGGKNFGVSTTLYKFDKIKRAKAAARAAHPDIPLIDMGVGEPDRPADAGTVRVLSEEAGKAENRWYSDNGIPAFQEAAAKYLADQYNVLGLNAYENILHGIGSKPLYTMLPLCLINPGDVTLATVPGYPIISTYTEYLGGEVFPLPLYKDHDFFPDFKTIPADIIKRAKLLYINYPNNPTGQVASVAFFKEVVEFATANNIVVVHDAAYAALTYDGYAPLSFLSTPGAMEIGVEIHSLSKAFNMTGWRLAFVAGNAQLIKALATIKDNTDSGQFRAIQKAGIYSLEHTAITAATCERYNRRFDLLVEALNDVGFHAHKPKGTFYCYVKSPKGTATGVHFHNAEEASEFLIKNALISTVPWDDAGAYLRFSVTFEADTVDDEKHIIEDMKKRLLKLELVF